MIRGEVSAVDLADVLREAFEEIVPPHRRAPGWDEAWQEVEEFAHATDKD